MAPRPPLAMAEVATACRPLAPACEAWEAESTTSADTFSSYASGSTATQNSAWWHRSGAAGVASARLRVPTSSGRSRSWEKPNSGENARCARVRVGDSTREHGGGAEEQGQKNRSIWKAYLGVVFRNSVRVVPPTRRQDSVELGSARQDGDDLRQPCRLSNAWLRPLRLTPNFACRREDRVRNMCNLNAPWQSHNLCAPPPSHRVRSPHGLRRLSMVCSDTTQLACGVSMACERRLHGLRPLNGLRRLQHLRRHGNPSHGDGMSEAHIALGASSTAFSSPASPLRRAGASTSGGGGGQMALRCRLTLLRKSMEIHGGVCSVGHVWEPALGNFDGQPTGRSGHTNGPGLRRGGRSDFGVECNRINRSQLHERVVHQAESCDMCAHERHPRDPRQTRPRAASGRFPMLA